MTIEKARMRVKSYRMQIEPKIVKAIHYGVSILWDVTDYEIYGFSVRP
jgi:hypothetical protein